MIETNQFYLQRAAVNWVVLRYKIHIKLEPYGIENAQSGVDHHRTSWEYPPPLFSPPHPTYIFGPSLIIGASSFHLPIPLPMDRVHYFAKPNWGRDELISLTNIHISPCPAYVLCLSFSPVRSRLLPSPPLLCLCPAYICLSFTFSPLPFPLHFRCRQKWAAAKSHVSSVYIAKYRHVRLLMRGMVQRLKYIHQVIAN